MPLSNWNRIFNKVCSLVDMSKSLIASETDLVGSNLCFFLNTFSTSISLSFARLFTYFEPAILPAILPITNPPAVLRSVSTVPKAFVVANIFSSVLELAPHKRPLYSFHK